jgi:16S rRNA (guanine(1405)-N(7))-methyltransferase
MDYAGWLQTLSQLRDRSALRTTCVEIMRHHASTRERLPILADFYTTILADLPPIHSILDLACGLNPLSIPWMPLAANARYHACDIYQNQVDFLNHVLAVLGVQGEASVCDLLHGCPTQTADVALLLKAIPCLEQVDKQIAPRLLSAIQAPVLIVSFPVHSLGGRQKGMLTNYERHLYELTTGQPWRIEQFQFATELVFRLVK